MAVCAPATLPAFSKPNVQVLGRGAGRRSFFEAGLEKDPHGPGTAGIDVDLKKLSAPSFNNYHQLLSIMPILVND